MADEYTEHTRFRLISALALVLIAALVVVVLVVLVVPALRSERPSASLADAWLTTKIQAQYLFDADVPARRVSVNTAGSHVTLSGPVANAREREQAVAIARTTDGVEQVTDRIWVESEAAATAGTVAPGDLIVTRIRAAFYDDQRLKKESIAVIVREGHVVLAGAVASEADRERAAALARQVDGVEGVDYANLVVIPRVSREP
jgi:hyperosmotically inducible protein